ncbi:MAG: alpha/beta hydrolase [Caldilinea sp. CFX5]|nr:alpha/beta hydrolase [Caldilinea sp. CFX5]
MNENHSVTRLGTNLHYWISGPATGPLVVFVHGATLDHRSFDAQLPPLVEAGYRVLTLDLRGHGASKPIGAEFTIGVLAEDLLTILDQVGADQVALVGHSFGGYVVQEFTRRYPDRVRCLVIIGCTNLAKKSSPFFRLLYHLFPFLLSRMSLATFHQRTLADLSLSPAVKVYAAQAMADIPKADFITIIMAGLACLWLDAGFSPTYVIPKPFLLTHGAQDHANGGVFPRESSAWAAREPNCRYEIIPDAEHAAHMDNPAFFTKLLLDFLRQHATP